jgi:hypothetical protein
MSRPGPLTVTEGAIAWTCPMEFPLVGLRIAGEARRLLFWGERDVVVTDYQGVVHRHRRWALPDFRTAAVDARCSRIALVVERQGLLVLNGRLEPLWDIEDPRILSVAITPLGELIAVGFWNSKLTVLDRYGRQLWSVTMVRPPAHLQFAAMEHRLFVGGESLYLACIDLDLGMLWHESISVPLGGLALPGDVLYVLVASLAYGLSRYGRDGRLQGTYQLRNGVSTVSVDFDGRNILALCLDGVLVHLSWAGQIQGEFQAGLEQVISAVLSPCGSRVFGLTSRGTAFGWFLSPRPASF